jgi:hypothetical protein
MNSQLESRFHRLAKGGDVWGTHSFSTFANLDLVGRFYRPSHQLPQFLQRTKPPNPADSRFFQFDNVDIPLIFRIEGVWAVRCQA